MSVADGSIPRAPGDIGVHVGPLDPLGGVRRRELCCPYCAALLEDRGHRAGDPAPYTSSYACPNCRGLWTIALERVEGP